MIFVRVGSPDREPGHDPVAPSKHLDDLPADVRERSPKELDESRFLFPSQGFWIVRRKIPTVIRGI